MIDRLALKQAIRADLLKLWEPGQVSDIRIFVHPKRTDAGYFDDPDRLADVIAQSGYNGVQSVYWTPNPVNPALLGRYNNRIERYAKKTTDDADIARRRWLLFDFDPTRPAGISSTDGEHLAALTHAGKVKEWLDGQGWPQPVVADSGNGGHLLYRIDLPNDDESRDLIRACVHALAAACVTPGITTDLAVYNSSRVWKLYQTIAVKGDNIPARPHRQSRILASPDSADVVPIALLRALAGKAPAAAPPAPRRVPATGAPTPDDIRGLLRCIPKRQDYADWIKCLMAVHSVFPGPDGVALVEEWSAGTDGEVAREFARFDPNGGVGVGTLYHIAKLHGWAPPEPTRLSQRGRVIADPREAPPEENATVPEMSGGVGARTSTPPDEGALLAGIERALAEGEVYPAEAVATALTTWLNWLGADEDNANTFLLRLHERWPGRLPVRSLFSQLHNVRQWIKDQRKAGEPGAAPEKPPPAKKTLDEVHEAFHRWLYLKSTDTLDAILAARAANLAPGDPVWLIVIGPPGIGKTEQLTALAGVRATRVVSTLTVPSLLSGTSAKERAANARGGLLREIGDEGCIVLKDFGSVLSMQRDARAELMAALRELFDGDWSRHVGTDGGQTLRWRGRLAVIAGSTQTVDEHHAVMASLGERFILYREPALDRAAEEALAERALELAGVETTMRAELCEAVAGLFAGIPPDRRRERPSKAERAWLIALVRLAIRGRAPVQRDGYNREMLGTYSPEAPTRIIKELAGLFDGLLAIGVARPRALELLRKVTLDSMPGLRLAALRALADIAESQATADVAATLSCPTNTTRRTLEDLLAHRLVRRTKAKRGEAESKGGKGDLWSLSDTARELWQAVTALPTPPDISGKQDIPSGSAADIAPGAGLDAAHKNGRGVAAEIRL